MVEANHNTVAAHCAAAESRATRAPQGDGFTLKPQAASFMEGTCANGEARLAWARSTFGMGWHGPNAWNGQAAITIGGRIAADANLAIAVTIRWRRKIRPSQRC